MSQKLSVLPRYRAALLPAIAIAALLIGMYAALRVQEAREADQGLVGFGGDFTLESVRGPVSLSDFRGQVVTIYFGYASCPDICPTSLGELAAVFRDLPENERESVQGIFISVDPERDTVAKLASYAQAFHPRILGVTGTPAEIAEVARRYGTVYQKVAMEDSAIGYVVDHSSIIFVVGRDGVVRSLVRHGEPVAELKAKIQEALKR